MRLNHPFASAQRVDLVPDFYGRPETDMVIPGHVSREPKPGNVVQATVHGAGFLVASARSAFGSKEYTVEVSTPEKPIKTAFRQTAIRMLLGLVIGLLLATFGSLLIAKRAIAPAQKIALAVRALPVIQPKESGKEIAVLEEIESLCATVNEMLGREDSFQIGTGLPAEALHVPGNRLGSVRCELANMFENKRQPTGIARTLLFLLKVSERLGDLSWNLATPSCADARKIRTERLRFYLGGLGVSSAERICLLTKELGAELTSERRKLSNNAYLARW